MTENSKNRSEEHYPKIKELTCFMKEKKKVWYTANLVPRWFSCSRCLILDIKHLVAHVHKLKMKEIC